MTVDGSDDVEENVKGEPQCEPQGNMPSPPADVEIAVFGFSRSLCGDGMCLRWLNF